MNHVEEQSGNYMHKYKKYNPGVSGCKLLFAFLNFGELMEV